MSRHWIKLWTVTLNDPKVQHMSEHLRCMFYATLLLAGIQDDNGWLPSLEDAAFYARTTEDDMFEAWMELEKIGITKEIGCRWMVVNFNKRQDSPSAARMRRYRERNKDDTRHSDATVTQDVTATKSSPATSSSASASVNLINNNTESIYRLYETEIGILTPVISDALKAAEEDYPLEWFLPAFQEAARNNARSWNYINAILKRWKVEGFQSQNTNRARASPSKPAAIDVVNDWIKSKENAHD